MSSVEMTGSVSSVLGLQENKSSPAKRAMEVDFITLEFVAKVSKSALCSFALPMTYKETIEHLYASLPMFQRIGGAALTKDLTNIRRLCDMLSQPQDAFRSIHIAGTNGKGSTSHILAAVFQAAGWKTGLYTSPHY